MSFKSVDEIIKYYTKELDKPMLNPEKQVDFKEIDSVQRYENGKRRVLVDMRMRNPHERIVPEGFCSTCKDFTTAYNNHGECEVCGTEVTADISKGEE